MVTVIDYRAGNLYNVGHALKFLGVRHRFSKDPEEVSSADMVILPGVGAAGPAIESLRERGLADVLKSLTVPFLGICLGMQLLFEISDEEETECLGVLPGSVRRFSGFGLKVPHIGWNQVAIEQDRSCPLFEGIASGSHFYFVHSYYVPCSKALTTAQTDYGIGFSAAVRKNNYFGVQFHPERSGDLGLRLLKNFVGIRHADRPGN
ncbi:MAG TPA: imidazole glycerol phosphate synthase subunit HisH [Acidobacteriota bacterium]|nr:imidazole glycerol phosphate synthase subunit HisH [Acidobacteriota bacterium]